MFYPFVLLAISFGGGFLGSLLGIGGGTFLIPILVIILKLSMIQAVPLALLCALGSGISGMLTAPPRGQDLHSAFIYEPAALVGALVCAPLVHVVPNSKLLILFAIFIFMSAFISLRNPLVNYAVLTNRAANLRGGFASLVTGACSGVFGVGGGIILVPLLQGFARMEVRRAITISLFLMISTSCVALLVHSILQPIDIKLGALCVLGSVPGGILAGEIRSKLSSRNTKLIFLLCSALISVSIFIKALGD